MCAAAPPGYSFTKRVFWNGAIHWMSYDNIYIRLDVDARKLIGTPMPSYPKILSEEKIWYFGECCGHLLLFSFVSAVLWDSKFLRWRGTAVIGCRSTSYVFHVLLPCENCSLYENFYDHLKEKVVVGIDNEPYQRV
ncbi:hypothetical protein HYC85_003930 [Camellia sinensis]|uniref:Uncharacterized protein n=1 Tax=Camellia sinensis TaxID=4442 RepID=A0A7J7HW15_CAMSI|nr:hypothetical protein HYC85_003930 [Camellia sinensis]